MRSIWVGIDLSSPTARVLAMAGPSEILLKARLAEPTHPRAVPWLLEAIALWQGAPVRAALAVGDTQSSSGTRPFHETLADFGGNALYSLEVVRHLERPRHRDDLPGLGDFKDLRQLLLFEVAR